MFYVSTAHTAHVSQQQNRKLSHVYGLMCTHAEENTQGFLSFFVICVYKIKIYNRHHYTELFEFFSDALSCC